MNYGEQKSGGSSSDAVAPVIAGILLVAMTVLMAAVVGVVVMSMANAESVPVVSAPITGKDMTITITHMAGAPLAAGTYKVMVDGSDRTKEFTGTGLSDGGFGPGDIISWTYSGAAPYSAQLIYVSPTNAEYLLSTKIFHGELQDGDGGLRPLIGYSPISGNLYTTTRITFTGSCTGEKQPDVWEWNFGDGSTRSGQTVDYTYPNPGDYIVSLTVKNTTTGGQNSTSIPLTVLSSRGITVMTWVKMSETPNQYMQIGYEASNQYTRYRWVLQYTSRHDFEFKVNTTSGNAGWVNSALHPQTDIWYHVCGIYDADSSSGNKALNIYINGTKNIGTTQNTPSGNMVGPGDIHWTSDSKIQLANAKVFARALTNEEILAEMGSPPA